MKEFIDNFSNREKALFIWIGVFFVSMLFSKSIRKTIADVIKAFFVKELVIVFITCICYTLGLIFIFYKVNFWNFNLLKDTILWTLGAAFIMVFNAIKVKDFSYFKEILKDTVKWTVIIEFLTGFYTFSIIKELILIPFLTFIVLLIAYSDSFEHQLTTEQKRVAPILKKVLSFLGICIFCFFRLTLLFSGIYLKK